MLTFNSQLTLWLLTAILSFCKYIIWMEDKTTPCLHLPAPTFEESLAVGNSDFLIPLSIFIANMKEERQVFRGRLSPPPLWQAVIGCGIPSYLSACWEFFKSCFIALIRIHDEAGIWALKSSLLSWGPPPPNSW
uniref:Uncharacterized protein n=1 Tax=Sphaerodactylus townsendi TaxID=933632 RepID=A0ACB8FK84_9SAUR